MIPGIAGQIVIGGALVLSTVPIHGAGMAGSLRWVRYAQGHRPLVSTPIRQSMAIGILVLIMFLATILEAVLWALAYEWLASIPTLEEALYFSLVTYTTVGYGDIVLPQQWRLLSSVQAANGVIVFGWTTAVILGGLRMIMSGREGD